jgi:four helix bundle protein
MLHILKSDRRECNAAPGLAARLCSSSTRSGARLVLGRSMSRDHRKLRVFARADDLVLRVYPITESLPVAERYGLQAQIRRAAISVPVNIVEGSTRASTAEYCRFLGIAQGSASEAAYLLDLAARLKFVPASAVLPVVHEYGTLSAGLLAAIQALRKCA